MFNRIFQGIKTEKEVARFFTALSEFLEERDGR